MPKTRRRLDQGKSVACESLEQRRHLSLTANLVVDLKPGPASGLYADLDSATASRTAGAIWFAGDNGKDGQTAFGSNGTAETTAFISTNSGQNPREIVTAAFGGKEAVFWVAQFGSHDEVFELPTQGNVTKRTTFAGTVSPSDLHVINSHVVFFDGSFSIPAVWSLGETGAAQRIAQVNGFGFMGNLSGFAYFAGQTTANDGSTHVGLWKTDGLTATLVRDFGSGGNVNQFQSTVLNGQLFFQAYEPGQYQLWKTDGTTTKQLSQVTDDDFYPNTLVASGGNLYFIGSAGQIDAKSAINQIWRCNGNTVQKVTSLNSGPSSFGELVDLNGQLFFTYKAQGSSQRLLYKLIGDTPTLVGTTTGGDDGGTDPAHLAVAGDTLFFSGTDTNGLSRLFQSDGSKIELVDGDAGFNPRSLLVSGNRLYYAASDPSRGTELHVVNLPAQQITAHLTFNSTIYEGTPVTFTCETNAPAGSLFYWRFGDVGTYYRTSSNTATPTFTDNLPGDALRRVYVKIRTQENVFVTASLNVVVHNAAPTLKVIMPAVFVPFVPMPFKFVVTDPGASDTAKVTVSWGGDVYTVGLDHEVTGTHTFSKSGIATTTESILVTAADNEGAAKSVRRNLTLALFVTTDQTLEALGVPKGIIVAGTRGNDRMKLNKAAEAPSGQAGFDLFLNGVTRGRFLFDSRAFITVGMGDGNDRLEVDPRILNRVIADGGAGNDTLGGGGASDFLRGGLGVDRFLRSDGKDRLIS